MFGTLLKKQMTEIFRGYFYDAKKNKKRSALSTVLFILLYIFIMVGILGGIFTYLSVNLCKPFVQVNMDWMYFLIMSMIAIALGAFGSVFNTYSGLYMSKDNDLLLALPIPVRSILAARLTSVYLLGLMYSAVVIVPAVIVYWVSKPVTLPSIVGSILLVILISLIVLILSCALGWCVAKISLKLKNKSFITVVVSLLFFAAYYFVYFKATDIIQDLLLNVSVYGEKVKNSVYPIYMFGKIGEGNVTAILIFTTVIFGITAFTFWILSRSFIKIVTSSGKTTRVAYKEKKGKMRSSATALLGKEFRRFIASPNYMLNCGLGSLFLIIVGVVLLIKGSMLTNLVNEILGAEQAEGMMIVMGAIVICIVAAMNDMVVPSVSLEGKNIWIVQSLPIDAWEVLRAKMLVQILVTGIPVIFCDICMGVVLKCGVIEMMLGMSVPILFTVFMTLFGMFLGIKMPNLTWTSELAPIKQSISVMIALFGGWAFPIILGVLYAGAGWKIGAIGYLAIVVAALVCFSAVLYFWLKKRGTKIFAWL